MVKNAAKSFSEWLYEVGYNNTFQDCDHKVYSHPELFILQIYSTGSSLLLASKLVAGRRNDL